MTMKRDYSFGLFFLLIVVLFLVLFAANRANAQVPQIEVARGSMTILQADGTPLPGDTPAIPTTPSELMAVYTLLLGSGVVTLLVSLEKKFVPNSVSAETLKQWTAAVVTVLFLVLAYTGNVSWFSKGSDVLTAVLPYVTGIVGVLFGSSALHQLSVKAGLPVFGYKRG